jgi:hypothetical protein
VDGGWTDWTCGACSAECGGGTRPCTRTCTAPEPSCGGAQCDGLDAMDEPCNVQSCCPPGYNVVNCNPSAPGDKDACEAALSASRATCQALGCTPSDPGACTVGGSPSNAECYGAIGTCN